MSQQPSRLNPGAFTFVPGQIPQNRQQGQPGEQGTPGAGGQQVPYGGPPPQGYYPQYGGGYQRGSYGQYGPPPGYSGGAEYASSQQQAYTPPHLRQQQPQQPSLAPDLLPNRPSFVPPQGDRLPIEREQPAQAPEPAPTIKLNIGGTSTAEKKGVDPPPSKTIKLNIGGGVSKEKEKLPLAPATTAPAKPVATPSIPKPTPTSAPESALSSATATGANTPLSKSAKDFNFTSDKSKTTADAVLNDTLAVADQDTLRDLYGDGEMVDPNGITAMRYLLNPSGLPKFRSQIPCQHRFCWAR